MAQGEGGGRPTLFTAKVRKRLQEAFENYAPVLTACEYAGIYKQNYYNWQKYSEECKKEGIENEHTKFFDLLMEIKSKRTFLLIDRIIEGKKGFQGACWYLERVQSDRFNVNGELMMQLMSKLSDIEGKIGK